MGVKTSEQRPVGSASSASSTTAVTFFAAGVISAGHPPGRLTARRINAMPTAEIAKQPSHRGTSGDSSRMLCDVLMKYNAHTPGSRSTRPASTIRKVSDVDLPAGSCGSFMRRLPSMRSSPAATAPSERPAPRDRHPEHRYADGTDRQHQKNGSDQHSPRIVDDHDDRTEAWQQQDGADEGHEQNPAAAWLARWWICGIAHGVPIPSSRPSHRPPDQRDANGADREKRQHGAQ